MSKSQALEEDLADEYSTNDQATLERWLREKFDFRYDVVLAKPFYKKTKDLYYKEMADRELNSIGRKLKLQGVKGSKSIKELLESDFCPEYHVFEDYFNQNSKNYHASHQAIKKLSQTLKVKNAVGADNFEKYLRKWMVGCVASALNTDFTGAKNHLCLTLIGEQGDGKSKWLDNLCPTMLLPYYYSGSLDLNDKDHAAFLGNRFLINIEEQLGNLNKKFSTELKGYISRPFISLRKSYGRYVERTPRRASCMGSVNKTEFLSDETGSRRFLAFLVTDINYKLPKIDIDRAWAEAYHLFKEDFVYWIPKEEIEDLNIQNSQFNTQTIAEELLLKYYKPAQKHEGEFMTVAEMLQYIMTWNITKEVNSINLGKALTKHKFTVWQKGSDRIKGYSVIKLYEIQ